MSWKDNIKKENTVGKELDSLIGEEGSLVQIMQMLSKELGVDAEIIYDSSSQPVLGFAIPIYIRCEMGTTRFPSNTSVFTIKNVGINKRQIK